MGSEPGAQRYGPASHSSATGLEADIRTGAPYPCWAWSGSSVFRLLEFGSWPGQTSFDVADGRVADGGLLIGSATIIEARDMDDAIAVASKHPTPQVADGAAFGWTIEIRPIHSFQQP